MKIGVVILCRYNSKRLPGKILKKINEKPILEYIIERVKEVFDNDSIIIATSKEKSDEPIVRYCLNKQINFYRGSLNNVAKRFLDASKSLSLDYAIRINGDNLFVDIPTLKSISDKLATGKYQFVSNVHKRTYPKGMSIEGVDSNYYEKKLRHFTEKEDREHVTLKLYKSPPSNTFFIYNKEVKGVEGLQLAVDTEKDLNISSEIIYRMTKHHTQYNLKEIFEIYKKLMI